MVIVYLAEGRGLVALVAERVGDPSAPEGEFDELVGSIDLDGA
jgi:hypothetical protein